MIASCDGGVACEVRQPLDMCLPLLASVPPKPRRVQILVACRACRLNFFPPRRTPRAYSMLSVQQKDRSPTTHCIIPQSSARIHCHRRDRDQVSLGVGVGVAGHSWWGSMMWLMGCFRPARQLPTGTECQRELSINRFALRS